MIKWFTVVGSVDTPQDSAYYTRFYATDTPQKACAEYRAELVKEHKDEHGVDEDDLDIEIISVVSTPDKPTYEL